MLAWPYLIIKGYLPYVNIAIAHTPHLLVSLASTYKIFGAGIPSLKFYTWSLVLLTDLILFFVTNKIWGKKAAVLSVVAYIIWQLFFDGNGLWFDLMLAPLALITFSFMIKKNYLWAGIFWAFMLFNKQTAVWFLIPVLFEILTEKDRLLDNIKGFVIGSAVTLAVWILGLWIWGVLPAFYEWAIKFGIVVLPRAQGQIQFPNLKMLAAGLLPFTIFVPFLLGKEQNRWSLLLWAFAGMLGAYPRFEFFHFQPAIPFLAFAVGITLSRFRGIRDFRGFWGIFVAIYLIGSLYLFSGFFLRNWKEGTRFYEQEVKDIAVYIKENTNSNDKIFVLNWWDSIYALSGRLPATDPLVPQLSWYQEIPGIQEKEVIGFIESKPKMIILYPYTESGLSAYVPLRLYNYIQTNYKLKEKVDGIEILIKK